MIYLCITPYFPTSASFRGPFVYDQVRAIERTGRFTRVVVIRPGLPEAASYEFGQVEVLGLPRWSLPSMLCPNLFDVTNSRALLRLLSRQGVALDSIGVVHVHSSLHAHYAVTLQAQAPQIRTIVQYHDPDPLTVRIGRVKYWGAHQRFWARRRVNALSQMDWHVGVSRMVLDQVQAFPQSVVTSFDDYLRVIRPLAKVPAIRVRNSHVLYNGVDRTKFYPDAGRRPDAKTFRIGCVGNFVDWKAQITLIRAAERLKRSGVVSDLRVIFVGSGPTRDACLAYVREHGLEDVVEVRTEVHHESLREFYASLDLFVLPSYFEGFGCVFLEAFACGVPFIAVKGQGISEYVPAVEEDNWLIDARDDASLAGKIEQYYVNRYAQHLNLPFDIDTLVGAFVEKLVCLPAMHGVISPL